MSFLLEKVGSKFNQRYSTVSGKVVLGQLLDIPDTSRVSNFLSARRYFRTKPKTELVPSDVLIVDGVSYIVGEHGTGFYRGPIYKHFKLFEVDEVLEGIRNVISQNTITGVNEVTSTLSLGNVHLSTQPRADIDDEIQIQVQTKIAIADVPLKLDDRVGPWIVTKSDYVLGITLLELKRI